jgi:hypothetical protein
MCQFPQVTSLLSLSHLPEDSITQSVQFPIGYYPRKHLSLNSLLTSYYLFGESVMDSTDESKQKRRSGAAEIFYLDEWDEVLRTAGKDKDKPYVVTDSLLIGIRFREEDKGKQLRIFMEKD